MSNSNTCTPGKRRAVVFCAAFGLTMGCSADNGLANDTDSSSDDDGDGPSSDGPSSDGGVQPISGSALFDHRKVHTVDITVDAVHLATLDSDSDERVPGQLTVDGTTLDNVGIRRKGQSTRRPLSDKPSFSIKVNEFVRGQRIDGMKKFLAHNEVFDPSLLNEALSYELYRRAGVPAPRTSHAIITFNGEPKGIYVLVEAIDRQFVKRAYGDGDGNRYEGPWDFPAGFEAAELKDEIEDGRRREDLEAFTNAVLQSSGDQLATNLNDHLEVDQFLTNAAVEAAFCLWDGYLYAAWNYYLYRNPQTDRFVMLPHGADWPFWQSDLDPFDLEARLWGPDGSPPGFLTRRFADSPELLSRYREHLLAVSDGPFDVQALESFIDDISSALHDAESLDSTAAADLARFDENVEEARSFLRRRKAYLMTRLGDASPTARVMDR